MNSNSATCLTSSATGLPFPGVTDCSHGRRQSTLLSEAQLGSRREVHGMSVGSAARRQALAEKGGRRLWLVKSQISTNEQELDGTVQPPLGVSHKIGDVVGEKYRITGVLGQGGVGTAYEAEREDGTTVALKALSLRNMKVWKHLELFEREARLLKSLRHPNIPQYIDYFEVDSSSDRAFYIAQKVAKGTSLADLVRSGWRFTEPEVVWIASEILQVLNYLGTLHPPVFHRDIKPENVIVDSDAKSVKVVDFGAVQDAASATLIGSTVIGTYGYMAPEQFQNRATSQTDLYGLGGTLLFLLSGRSPSSFPQKRLKVDFSSVTVSPRLVAVIEKLLEPAPEDRFQSPRDVINALKSVNESLSGMESVNIRGDSSVLKQRDSPAVLRRPAGTKVDLQKSAETLEIAIPPGVLNAETARTGTFAVAWNATLALWTRLAWSRGIVAWWSLPFWFVGIGLMRKTLSRLSVTVNLKIDEDNFEIEWGVGNLWKYRVAGSTSDINSANVITEKGRKGRLVTTCRIVEGVNVHNFGSELQLVEKVWIIQEIRNFLGLPVEDPRLLL